MCNSVLLRSWQWCFTENEVIPLVEDRGPVHACMDQMTIQGVDGQIYNGNNARQIFPMCVVRLLLSHNLLMGGIISIMVTTIFNYIQLSFYFWNVGELIVGTGKGTGTVDGSW